MPLDSFDAILERDADFARRVLDLESAWAGGAGSGPTPAIRRQEGPKPTARLGQNGEAASEADCGAYAWREGRQRVWVGRPYTGQFCRFGVGGTVPLAGITLHLLVTVVALVQHRNDALQASELSSTRS